MTRRFVIVMLGGAGPPPQVLPHAMDVLGSATPMRPLVTSLQDPCFADGRQPFQLLVPAALGGAAWIVAAFRLRHD